MIEKLVILRHGEPISSREGLTESGIAMIAAKAPRIETLLGQSPYPIFSSHVLRSIETAVIYAKSTKNVLWIKSDSTFYQEYWADLSKFINNYKDARAMVITAHLEHIRDFPSFYCSKHLNFEPTPLEHKQLGHGRGVLIDRIDKTCKPV